MKPGAWHKLRQRGDDVKLAIGLFSVALLILVCATVILEARAEREEAIAAAIKQSSNLAVAYEEHVIRTLKGLDAVTLFIRHEYEHHGLTLDMPKFAHEGVVDPNLFSILSKVDPGGNVVLNTHPGAAAYYADRDFFRAQLDESNRLYISSPVLGRVSGTWQVPMSRRITRADGSFGGVIVLSVDPGYFTRFYQKADLGAERLRKKVAESPAVRDERRIEVTVSIGIAVIDAGDESGEAALGRADAALHRAKEGGRNRVEIAAGRGSSA